VSKIILDVNSSDINTVLTILNNLKAGLIKNISVNGQNKNTSPTPSSTTKYLSPNEYKNRLKKDK